MALRIGLVHWAFPPVTGGVEMHLRTIGPELVRQGAEVALLVGSMEGQPTTETVEGMTVERRDGMVPERLDEARAANSDIYASSRHMFEAFLDRHTVDVVHAHNLHLDFFDLSRALVDVCKDRGIPTCLVIHNPVFIDRSEAVTRRIVTEIDWDRLVPVSDYIRETMRQQMLGIPDDVWTVIKHGIDTDKFHPVTPRRKAELKERYGFEGRSVILHTARFLPWKGILPAIKAMPLIVDAVPDALLVMPGRGERIYKDDQELADYDEAIDRTIETHALGNYVHIAPYERDDIPHLTALSDVVIYTTIGHEPFGLVPVEGMASGVPVVVTRSGGMVESVVDGETGFIIPRDEEQLPQALAEHVIQLLLQPDLRGEMGARGRQRVEIHFDKRRMARDLLRLSEELIRQ